MTRKYLDLRPLFITALILLFMALKGGAQAPVKPPCAATTKAGAPCKGKAKANDTFCFVHSASTNRCGAPTAAKGQCRMVVKEAGTRCRFHVGK